MRRKINEAGSYRKASEESGVNYNTLNQIVNNGRLPEYDHFEQICKWLGQPVGRYLPGVSDDEAVTIILTKPMPDTIADLLNSDPRLTPEAARVMSVVFREAYNFYVKGGKFDAVKQRHNDSERDAKRT